MNILIIDSTPRGQAIAEIILEAASIRAISAKLQIYKYSRGAYKVFSSTKEWNPSPLQNTLDIRLRHSSETYPDMPSAKTQIHYSGYSSGSKDHDDPDLGHENGIPYAIPSGYQDARNTFPVEWVLQMIDFDDENARAAFLRRKTYNPSLEEEIITFSQGNRKVSFNALQEEFSRLFFPKENRKKGQGKIRTLFFQSSTLHINPQHLLTKFIAPIEYKHDIFEKTIISSKEEWDQLSDLSDYDLVVLPAELTWDKNQTCTNFEGIAIAGDLRRKQFAGISLLPSVAPSYIAYYLSLKQEVMLNVLNYGFSYLCDISPKSDGGVSFLDRTIEDEASEHWSDMRKSQKREVDSLVKTNYGWKMMPARMEDVRYSLLPVGKFSAIIHEFKQITQFNREPNFVIENIQRSFRDLNLIIDRRHTESFRALEQQTLKQIAAHPEQGYDIFLRQRDKISTFLPEDDSGETKKNQIAVLKNWGMLLVEDDEDTASHVLELLKTQGIRVWWERSVSNAIELLKKDYESGLEDINQINDDFLDTEDRPKKSALLDKSFIRIALTDIRIQTKTERWDVLQGYDLIEEIRDMPNFTTPVILTQQERRMIRRSSETNTIWFPKSILLSGGTRELFLEKILELGEKQTPPIPKMSLWKKGYPKIHQHPFSVYYKWLREDAYEYKAYEKQIQAIAKLYFELWKAIFDDKDDKDELNAIRNEINTKRQGINITDGITTRLDDDKVMPLFCAKLAARRGALIIADYLLYADPRLEESESADKKPKDIKNLKNSEDYEDIKRERQLRASDKKSYLSDRLGEICSLLRSLDFCYGEEPINADLLNKHLGLDTHVYKWFNNSNEYLLLEEYEWLKEMRPSYPSRKA